MSGRINSRQAFGFSARFFLDFDKNWLEIAIRSWSTGWALEMYVTLGTPCPETVAITAGMRPLKHP